MHILQPKHVKLKSDEVKKLLDKYNISSKQLPMINIKDPALKDLGVKTGDIIKIVRWSPTSKATEFFRVVIDG